jgi:hypothetical protein
VKLRENLERPEIRWMRGRNELAGTVSERIMNGARKMLGAEE